MPLIRPRGNLWIAEADKADRLRAIYATESRQSPPDAGPLPLISIAEALEMVPFLNPGWPAAAIPDADC